VSSVEASAMIRLLEACHFGHDPKRLSAI